MIRIGGCLDHKFDMNTENQTWETFMRIRMGILKTSYAMKITTNVFKTYNIEETVCLIWQICILSAENKIYLLNTYANAGRLDNGSYFDRLNGSE